MAEIPKSMTVYVDEKAETKNEINELKAEQRMLKAKLSDLNFYRLKLEHKVKRDRILNIVWTICVGIIIFLLAINY